MMDHPKSFLVEIGPTAAGLRLDQALARSLQADAEGRLPRLSRTRLRKLLEEGAITAVADSGASLNPTRIANAGECFRINPGETGNALAPEPARLEILYEDAHLLVLNKPPGMLVHPAHKGHTGTLAHALLAHCGPALAGVGHPLRPGIVHRLDIGTGGLLVAAKQETARLALADRFAAHDIEREYLAIVWGVPSRASTALAGRQGVSFHAGARVRIDAPLGPDPRRPTRRAVLRKGGRRAVTHLHLAPRRLADSPQPASILRCRLETGRTHQIRVHLQWIGHPLVGDPSYGRNPTLSPALHGEQLRRALAEFPRPALHASRLGFRHPATGRLLRFGAPPHADFAALARLLDAQWPESDVEAPRMGML